MPKVLPFFSVLLVADADHDRPAIELPSQGVGIGPAAPDLLGDFVDVNAALDEPLGKGPIIFFDVPFGDQKPDSLAGVSDLPRCDAEDLSYLSVRFVLRFEFTDTVYATCGAVTHLDYLACHDEIGNLVGVEC